MTLKRGGSGVGQVELPHEHAFGVIGTGIDGAGRDRGSTGIRHNSLLQMFLMLVSPFLYGLISAMRDYPRGGLWFVK